MTTHPAAAALGANSADSAPPAENRPICAAEKSNWSRRRTLTDLPRNCKRLPSERSLASRNS